MKPDYLYGTPFLIMQPKGVYHFSSDTEFLGRMLEAEKGDMLLDIGTNTGALMLYGAMHTVHISGIDLFPEICETARENLRMNHLTGTVHEGRIQDFHHAPYDVIVCNPPYFSTGREDLKNENPYLRAARHEEFLTPAELFAAVRRLLCEDGVFWMVHRASRRNELIRTAAACGLFLHSMRLSYDRRGGTKKSCVLSFGRQEREPVQYAPAWMDMRDSFAEKEIIRWNP